MNKIIDFKQHIRNNSIDQWCERLQSYCWIWQKYIRKDGYGETSYNKVPRRIDKVHKVSYLEFKGEISEGLCVLHHCDNPACCNPEHLYLGTLKDNAQDMLKRRRLVIPKLGGEKHPNSRLTGIDILNIRTDYATGKYTYYELGKKYGVDFTTIGKIVKYNLWKNVA